ncbi:hypothetical protein T4E_8399 [Trichinella pseudospiralis]|uniref:Uncharacterized protein n=1 Tax=Trichinella pseudospiralis TaxID=6337 RepID=A0A0V0XU10_TRIPS|nr:hypothetical protein T4E_8399 [Trichinella pseudospiralis]
MPKLTNSCYASSEKQASSFVGLMRTRMPGSH